MCCECGERDERAARERGERGAREDEAMPPEEAKRSGLTGGIGPSATPAPAEADAPAAVEASPHRGGVTAMARGVREEVRDDNGSEAAAAARVGVRPVAMPRGVAIRGEERRQSRSSPALLATGVPDSVGGGASSNTVVVSGEATSARTGAAPTPDTSGAASPEAGAADGVVGAARGAIWPVGTARWRRGLKGAKPFTKRQSRRHMGHVVWVAIQRTVQSSQKACEHGKMVAGTSASVAKQTGQSTVSTGNPLPHSTRVSAASSLASRPLISSSCISPSKPRTMA